ncbi:uncharacterized protein M6B38_148095 [Iris pallida]|uniref:Uncharacterized protein n=1 Tax=Iris pallida TaxID=29817 RepID=A0AAX6F8M5_IRIPA|nr:uncharacterized protein M6B38_148095 [Iris pallida]
MEPPQQQRKKNQLQKKLAEDQELPRFQKVGPSPSLSPPWPSMSPPSLSPSSSTSPLPPPPPLPLLLRTVWRWWRGRAKGGDPVEEAETAEGNGGGRRRPREWRRRRRGGEKHFQRNVFSLLSSVLNS